jgi:hypothetical protein
MFSLVYAGLWSPEFDALVVAGRDHHARVSRYVSAHHYARVPRKTRGHLPSLRAPQLARSIIATSQQIVASNGIKLHM